MRNARTLRGIQSTTSRCRSVCISTQPRANTTSTTHDCLRRTFANLRHNLAKALGRNPRRGGEGPSALDPGPGRTSFKGTSQERQAAHSTRHCAQLSQYCAVRGSHGYILHKCQSPETILCQVQSDSFLGLANAIILIQQAAPIFAHPHKSIHSCGEARKQMHGAVLLGARPCVPHAELSVWASGVALILSRARHQASKSRCAFAKT